MKKQLAIFDFDGTIYKGDITLDFIIFFYRKYPLRIYFILFQVVILILYMCRIINKTKAKYLMLQFTKYIYNINEFVSLFHKSILTDKFNQNVINRLIFLKQNNNNLLCISATPDFIIEKLCISLGFDDIIATKTVFKNNKLISLGPNCRGHEKIAMLKQKYNINDYIITEAYSDNKDDINLLKLSIKPFFIKNNKIVPL